MTGKERATLRSKLGHARNALESAVRDAEAATSKAHRVSEDATQALLLAGRAERLACEALREVEAILKAYPETAPRAAAIATSPSYTDACGGGSLKLEGGAQVPLQLADT